MSIIDFSEQIRGLPRDNAVDHSTSTEKLIAFHGGFFREDHRITLAQVGRCRAVAKLAVTGKGIWFYGLDKDYATGGSYWSPSVWDRHGYTSRTEALAAAKEDAARFFERIATEYNSCVSDNSREDCRKVVEILRPLQLGLFE